MTNQDILTALNLTDAPEVTQQAALDQVHAVVDMRLLGAVRELLTDEQLTAFTEQQSSTNEADSWKWLDEQLGGKLDELRAGLLTDYLAERTAAK